jgi:HEAT repeat protein
MAVDEYRPDIDELKNKKDVNGLIEALDHEDIIIVKEAARALKYVGDERAVDALIQTLQFNDHESNFAIAITIRGFSAEALGIIGDERAVIPLILTLDDESSEVRWKAAEALGNLGDGDAEEALILILENDPDADVRKYAAGSLGKIGGENSVESLIAALNDKEWPVRKNAVTSLGQIGDERALKPILKSLEDEDTDVKRQSIHALEKMKKSAFKPLLKKLYDVNWQNRAMAAEALGRIGDKRAVEPLSKALSNSRVRDENRYVRGKAAEALGRIGSAKAVPYLEKALNEKYIFVRKRAQEALDRIELSQELIHFANDYFAFDYPFSWDIEEIYEVEKLIIGYSPDKNIKFSFNLKAYSEDISANDFASIIMEVFEEQNAIKTTKKEITVDGAKGYRLSSDNFVSAVPKRTIVVTFKRHDDLFYFWFAGSPSDMEEYYKYIEIMINSFHLT